MSSGKARLAAAMHAAVGEASVHCSKAHVTLPVHCTYVCIHIPALVPHTGVPLRRLQDECSLYNASVANTTAAAAAAAATTVDPLTLTALPTTPSLTNPNDPIFVSFDNYNDNLEAKHNVYMDNCTYTRLNAGGPGCNPDNAVLPLRTGLTLLHAAWTLTLGLLLSLLSLFW